MSRGGERALALFVIASLGASIGCARQSGDRDLQSMREELARVQHDRDALQSRIEALEAHEASAEPAKSDDASASASTPEGEPKALKVVKLTPTSATTEEATAGVVVTTPSEPPPIEDDDAPRPFLKIDASGISETDPDEEAPKGKAAAKIEAKAVAEYDGALKLVKAKKWKEALDAFASFVVRYPDHAYVGNAIYWRGECYASLGEWSSAIAQLEGLMARFPASGKTADALLTLGVSYRKMGSTVKAKAAFDRLKKEFPKSDAAKKAEKLPAEAS